MTRARMAWRVAGEVDPSSLRIEGDVVSCTVDLPDADIFEIRHDGYYLLVNHKEKVAVIDEKPIIIGPIPFAVLVELSRDPRSYHSATELYREVWKGDLSKVSTRSVDAAVSVVRRQLPIGWVVNKIGTGWRLLP